eukprot:scaffold399252_cov33-Prasinocladus_malaysianus.AAC.1
MVTVRRILVTKAIGEDPRSTKPEIAPCKVSNWVNWHVALVRTLDHGFPSLGVPYNKTTSIWSDSCLWELIIG